MTRYLDPPTETHEVDGYREGVDRVLEYIESTYSYPKLMGELKWAIDLGLI